MDWEDLIKNERKKAYYQELMNFVNNEYQTKKIYPPQELIFKALELTRYDKVKVVIIGQDPYASLSKKGKPYANGLAFSTKEDTDLPKSLQNIFKELRNEFSNIELNSGDLSAWARNGVLLLNTILTVEENKPLSHRNKGWEVFTLEVIKALEKNDNPICYILLGNNARSYKKYLTNINHYVLESSHPSPLGAYKGFIGSNIFKSCSLLLDLSQDFWQIK